MISVVIPTYNRAHLVVELLYSIAELRGAPELEVCVVDNGSIDDTVARVSRFAWVKLVRLGCNRGNVVARNIGLANTSGDIVVMLDDDTVVRREFFDLIAERFAADPRLGLIACVVHDFGSRIGTPNNPPDPEGREVEAWTGCGGALRRELAQGFSEYGLLASAWEWELVAQVRERGYTIKSFADINVLHRFAAAGGGAYRLSLCKRFEATRVPILFWARYGRPRQLLWHGWRWSHAIAQATLEQRTGLYLRGYASTLRLLPRAWKNREPVKPEVAAKLRPTLRFKGK
jgi:glycosyltransferase involved in cell wall biosynthesis